MMGPSPIGCFRKGPVTFDSEVNAHQARCPRSCCPPGSCLNGECVMIIILGLIVLVAVHS
jgi:hypothetical protein